MGILIFIIIVISFICFLYISNNQKDVEIVKQKPKYNDLTSTVHKNCYGGILYWDSGNTQSPVFKIAPNACGFTVETCKYQVRKRIS